MASIEYAVRATDLASTVFAKIALSADGLDQQLEDLGKRVAEPEVDLKDAAFTQGMIRCAERIDKLSAAMAEPGVDLSDKKFQSEIFKINAQLDRLDKRHVTATVDVNVDRSLWSRLRGGGGGLGGLLGGGGGAAGPTGLGTGLAGLGNAGPAVIGIAAALAAALAPALLPAGLGLLAGGGAAGGALLMGSKAEANLLKLQTSLKSATGANRRDIQQQIATLRRTQGPELAVSAAGQNVFGTALSTFSGALSAPGRGFSGGGPGGTQGAPAFMTSLLGILKQIAGFTKTLQPMLADLFRASVPYLRMFVGFLEQATKTLLPVFAQSLRQMTPFLPMISQGLLSIVQGLAGMIKALGPGGMKASAEIFVALCKVMEFTLPLVGKAAAFLAENIVKAAHNMRKTWDWAVQAFEDFRHRTAVIFDGVRHDIAHIWDLIFENSIGMVIRLVHNVETQYNSLRHGIASRFDDIRHDIAHYWDMIWNNTIGRIERGLHDVANAWDTLRHDTAAAYDDIRHKIAAAWDTIWQNTIGRVKNGISDVVGWFKRLPGMALNALEGLGTLLWNFGSMALGKLWNGMKHGFDAVWSWFKSLPSKLLHAIGVHSPPDWAIEAGKHIMGGLLKGITSRKDELQNAFAASAKFTPGSPHYGSTAAAIAFGRAHLPAGWSWGALYSLWQQESGWSPYAVNKSSGAYGIPQSLGHGHPYNLGDYANQIRWGLSYIAGRYGNSQNAWAHEQQFNWYGSGLAGGIFNRPTLIGVGERGPERVDITPAGAGKGAGGITIQNLTITLPPGSDREQGRRIVGYIRSFEQGSGAGWRR